MKTSEEGLTALALREGKKNKAYRDTKGILTIGVGHTGPDVYEGLAWTDAQIDEALAHDVKEAEDCINKYVTKPLSQNQFDALVSFVFNIGTTRFITSTMCRVLNLGDYMAATKCFDMWHIPKEIIPRRNSERDQFHGIV